jgi:hypothetical protein
VGTWYITVRLILLHPSALLEFCDIWHENCEPGSSVSIVSGYEIDDMAIEV